MEGSIFSSIQTSSFLNFLLVIPTVYLSAHLKGSQLLFDAAILSIGRLVMHLPSPLYHTDFPSSTNYQQHRLFKIPKTKICCGEDQK